MATDDSGQTRFRLDLFMGSVTVAGSIVVAVIAQSRESGRQREQLSVTSEAQLDLQSLAT